MKFEHHIARFKVKLAMCILTENGFQWDALKKVSVYRHVNDVIFNDEIDKKADWFLKARYGIEVQQLNERREKEAK